MNTNRVTYFFILVLFLAAPLSLRAQENQPFQQLYELVDNDLQVKLEKAVNAKPAWRKLSLQNRLSVGVVDMSSEPARFARLNGNVMMYAASMPKIAILLAAYASFEDGSLSETAEIHTDLGDMIHISSNDAATRMIDLLGYDKINSVLQDPHYGFYDYSRGGGLWVGKRFAATGVRKGDPIHNISHGATVTQVCRFYYQLANGRLINPDRSKQMLQDLSHPGLHHKFVGVIEKRAPAASLFRKSGTWKNWHSDSIMVQGPDWRNYILTAMVESPNGEQIIREILPVVEDILHK